MVFISFLCFLEGNVVTFLAINRVVDVFVEIWHDHKDEQHQG